MKRLLKFVSLSLVMIFCFLMSFGCSCAKPIKVEFNVLMQNENKESNEIFNIESKVVVYKKFREPANTACYQKIEDEYILIEDATGVSSCYDAEGNKFEKATYKTADKVELTTSTYNAKAFGNNALHQTKAIDVPENENYSLIYEIEIKNMESYSQNGYYTAYDLYVKEFGLKDILGDKVNEDSYSKITFTTPADTYLINGENYYKIGHQSVFNNYDVIKFTVELKGLTSKDLKDNNKVLDILVPIEVKLGESYTEDLIIGPNPSN